MTSAPLVAGISMAKRQLKGREAFQHLTRGSSRRAYIHPCQGRFMGGRRCFASVTGNVYTAPEDDQGGPPSVLLFTKEGCTLCDKVKDVLKAVRETYPHSLDQIDITDREHRDWFDRYKYDIPVLHINGMYWTKHRLSREEAEQTLQDVLKGDFKSPKGEPNAGKSEVRKT